MREIKFRAWDKKEKKMLQPKELCRLCFNEKIPYAFFTWDGNFVIHDGFILMQYTGLRDKNGVEIYEGDVLAYSGKTWRYVRWEKELSAFVLNCICKDIEGSWDCFDEYIPEHEFEIIGNIYENPELLEEK